MKTADKTSEKNVGVVLLAAGGSSRMGRPKQSLFFKGKTLLQQSVEVANASNATSVIVVLGDNAETLQKEIQNKEVYTVINGHWQNGMASSITFGVRALLEIDKTVEGLVLMVCDQPFISASVVNELIIVLQNTGKHIVTCGYGDTFGPPTLFHKSLFPELMKLTGDIGGRSIIEKHKNQVEVIPFPEGIVDIDTEADYQKLKQRTAGNDKRLL